MSDYDSSSIRAPSRGDDEHLTRDEEQFIRRYLSRPESFTEQFWRAVLQKSALDQELIPQSNVQGLRRLQDKVDASVAALEANRVRASVAEIATAEGANWDSPPADLTTPGPSLSGLVAGSYVIFAQTYIDPGSVRGIATVLVNGASVFTLSRIGPNSETEISFAAATLASASNTVTIKYHKSDAVGTATFSNRRLLAMKLGS